MTEVKSISRGLLRHSVFMFVATQFANAANFLFQVVALRKLPNVEYGVLATMLSIYLIASTPLDALRTAMAHFTARAMRTGDTGSVRWITRNWCFRLGWLTLILLAVGFLSRDFIATFFHLESGMPFFVTCALIGCTFYLLLFAGVFQGIQNFYWMSASMHLWVVFRVLFLLIFVMFAATAMAGLAAHGVASAIGIALSLCGLHYLLRKKPSRRPPTGIGVYFIRSILMLGSYAVLMNADLIFVKHYFSPEEAGVFAKAAVIGRAVIFLPMPIALVMFPKVVTSGPSTRDSRVTLIRALAIVGLLVGSAVGVIIALPWLPLLIMSGISNPDPELTRLLILLVLAMTPLTLTYLLVNYEMAQHRFAMTWVLILCSVLYIGGVMIWHDTMLHVAYVLGGVSTLSALAFTLAILWRAGRRHRAGGLPDSPEEVVKEVAEEQS